jgi:hypothetical protein
MKWIGSTVQATCVSAVLLAALVPPAAVAQGADAKWRNVRVIQVKPDRQAEWITLQKEMNAAMKKAGQSRDIWQVARGNVDTFHIGTTLSNLGQNDSTAENALGAERFASWALQVAQCVGDRQVVTIRRRPELTIPPKDGRVPQLAVLALRTVIPGKRAEYESYLKNDYIPAMKKAKADGVFVNRIFMGDNPDTYAVVNFIDKWSEFDSGHPLVRELGQQKANAIFDKASTLIQSSENLVLRYRPDLSVQP